MTTGKRKAKPEVRRTEEDAEDQAVNELSRTLVASLPRPVNLSHALKASIVTAIFKRANTYPSKHPPLTASDLAELVGYYWDSVEMVELS